MDNDESDVTNENGKLSKHTIDWIMATDIHRSAGSGHQRALFPPSQNDQ